MDSSTNGSVLGHYSLIGGSLQPLLPDSTQLFQALVEGNLSGVTASLDGPEGCTRLHNVLYWRSSGERAKGNVQIVQRTLLQLAAHAAVGHGNLTVVQYLLQQGADPQQRSPDGITAIMMTQQAHGEHVGEVLTLLQSAAAMQHQAGPASARKSYSADGSSPHAVKAASITRSSSGNNRLVEASLFAPTQDHLNTFSADASSSDHGSRDANPAAFSLGVDLQHHLSLHHQDVDVDPFIAEGCCLPYSTSELVQPEYATDDFRMFAFKVLRCSKRFAHDWRACPFAHPTENARRRDPREFRYCAIACPDYKQGFCVRGDLCSYAHGVFEAWLHPSRYRTQLCKDGANCHRPICFFAHSLNELRTPTFTWTPGSEDAASPEGSSGVTSSVAQVSDLASSVAQVARSGSSGLQKSSSSGLQSTGTPSAAAAAVAAAAAATAHATARTTPVVGVAHLPASSSSGNSPTGSVHTSNSGMGLLQAQQPQQGRAVGDAGFAVATAAGAVPPVAPNIAAAAMFGFSAPRMSNAFARRHGLNPKDNAMLNLQKIALQAQPGSLIAEQLNHMFHGAGSLPSTPVQSAPDPYLGHAFGSNSGLGAHMAGVGSMQASSGKGMYGSTPSPTMAMGHNTLMMQGYPYSPHAGLMPMQAMQGITAPATGHDLSGLGALNHHLASLSLHPSAAAAYGASPARGLGMGMGMGGFGMGMGMGFGQPDPAMAGR